MSKPLYIAPEMLAFVRASQNRVDPDEAIALYSAEQVRESVEWARAKVSEYSNLTSAEYHVWKMATDALLSDLLGDT